MINAAEMAINVYPSWSLPAAPAEIVALLMGYKIEIAKMNTLTPASLVVTQTTSDTGILLTPLPDGVYYWRVRALFGPTLDAGPWSIVFKFTLDQTAPLAPILKTPLTGVLITTRRPVFTWAAAASAVSYSLQLATDSEFVWEVYTESINAPTLSYATTAAQSLPNDTYYWRVIARDAAGNLSAASVVRRFTISAP